MRNIAIFLLVAASLFAKESSFNYAGVGVQAYCVIPMGAEVSLGRRTLYEGHHAWDRQVGLGAGVYGEIVYVQSSYLYYWKPNYGFYQGIGWTFGAIHCEKGRIPGVGPLGNHEILPYANILITFGYQYKSGNFFQVQVTPLLTVTATYGIKF